MERIAVILNPNSRKNRRRGRRAAELSHVLGRWGEVVETRHLEELGPAVRDLLGRGADCLVADGGDGSLHCVVNEAIEQRGDAGLPPFLPTNGGTIDFVARKMGLRGDAVTLLGRLCSLLDARRPPPLAPLDTLEVTGTRLVEGGPARPFRRVGFALAAGGVGQRFFEQYYRERVLGAPAIVKIVSRAVASHAVDALGLPAPRSWLRWGRQLFEPTRARVQIDGERLPWEHHRALHAGAFDVSLGGVFHVFPLAREPGRLCFHAGAIQPVEAIASIPSLVRGGPIRGAEFVERAGDELRIEALQEPLTPVLDGELIPGVLSLTVRRGPRIRVPRLYAGPPEDR